MEKGAIGLGLSHAKAAQAEVATKLLTKSALGADKSTYKPGPAFTVQ